MNEITISVRKEDFESWNEKLYSGETIQAFGIQWIVTGTSHSNLTEDLIKYQLRNSSEDRVYMVTLTGVSYVS
jgi:hypothetical protein